MSDSDKVRVLLPEPADLLETQDQDYADVIGLLDFFRDVDAAAHVILNGPKGIGKTMGVKEYARREGIPVLTRPCSSGTRQSDFDGHFILVGDETPFLAGDFPSAIHVANEVGICIYLMEEINALQPERQKDVNQLTHDGVSYYLKATKEVYRLDDDVVLWVVGSMNPCFHPDTDVLTPKGVKRIMELKEGDAVYSINQETGERELDKVTAVWGHPCTTGLVHIEGNTVDLLVTPNHEILWKGTHENASWSRNTAEDVFSRRAPKSLKLPKPSDLPFDEENRQNTGSTINLAAFAPWGKSHKVNRPIILNPPTWEDFCSLLGYYLADGSAHYYEEKKDYRITITRNSDTHADLRSDIESILSRMGITFNSSTKCVTFSDKMLYNALVYAGGRYSEHKTIHPYILSAAPKTALKNLFECAYACDGNQTGNGRRYTTKSEDLARQMTWLANVVMGEATAWHSPDFDGYRIGLSRQRDGSCPKSVTPLAYEGTVINVSVEKNKTLCAGRNGKFTFVGNSTYGGVHSLNEDLVSRVQILEMGYPEAEAEKAILFAQVPSADSDVVKNLVNMAAHTRAPSFKYSLSPRDLVQVLRLLPKLGLEKALALQTGKFPDHGKDRDTYKKLIQDAFDVDLNKVSVLTPKTNNVKRASAPRKRVLPGKAV